MKTNHEGTRIGTRTDGPPSTTTGAKMLLHFCPVGVTLSWEEAPPGARASRPHKSSRSFGHLLHRNQPAAAPCLCFGRAHAVPAGRAVGCNIAGKLSGNRRDSMRAGRPRSQGNHSPLEGESQKPSRQAKAGAVGGVWRATSQKADVRPLGNSRLPASPAPALAGGSFESETGFVSGKWSVPGAGKLLMTWLHYLKDCAEINKMLNASIKSLATIHWPLSTIHLAGPPPPTTGRIIRE